jgi:8-hydroxy-5-deazaflavin:NADPH oxidoreductase
MSAGFPILEHSFSNFPATGLPMQVRFPIDVKCPRRGLAQALGRRPTVKTAIIGLGNIGFRLAGNLIAGGQDVIVAERDFDKAKEKASKLGAKAHAMTMDVAVAEADVVILAIWLDAIKNFLTTYRGDLAGKIVVDPSNPIASDGKGGFKKTVPADQSSGQIIAGLLPEGAELVKAFGTLSAESLTSAANRPAGRAVLFYATDYPEAGEAVAKLITASGFAPVNIGGIDQSIRIEVGGDLHQLGKLGKPVSLKEAQLALNNRRVAPSGPWALRPNDR